MAYAQKLHSFTDEERERKPFMKSIIDYVEHWAATHPEKLMSSFLNLDGKEINAYTYLDFSNQTRNLAEYLSREVGLRHGDTVLLVYPPGLEIVVAFLACARIGAIPVPVSPLASTNLDVGLAKMALIAHDCQAKVVLTTQTYQQSYYRLLLARRYALRSSISGTPLPDLKWVVTDEVQSRASERFRNDPNPILFLQYTSGSTSEPKGVMVSHENVIHNASSTLDHVPIGVSWLPQYHDMGLIGYYLFPIIAGGTTYGFSPVDFLKRPILWLQTICRVRATYASSPNFGFEYCLREDKIPSEQLENLDLSSLRVLMNAAEPVRADTYLRFLKRFAPCGLQPEACVVAYGLAENTLAATNYGRRILTVNKRLFQKGAVHLESSGPRNSTELRLASCGKPLEGIRLRIVNSESRAALGEGRIGEVWLSGKSSCTGYWKRPKLTRATFGNFVRSDPKDNSAYVRTGDLGFLHDGELFVCGRIKDLIIIRGVNYYPQDIEAIVESASEKIRARGIAAFNGDEQEETLVVVAELRKSADLPDPAEIARAIRTQYYVTPQIIVFVRPGAIAKTTSGKVARSRTRQRWLNGELPVIATHNFVDQNRLSGESAALRHRFRYITEAYDLVGREEETFGELGIDSLNLVQFLLDVQDLLQEKGAADLADEVDVQVLQELTVGRFFYLLELFEKGPEEAVIAWRDVLARVQREYESRTMDCMSYDATLEPHSAIGIPTRTELLTNVLVTGATGFFGPFLLSSLLRRTSYTYYVLTRASDPGHGMDRIRDSLRRSLLWTPSLAEQVEKRVHVVCGDISEHNLGLSSEQWESLAAQIGAVCHNAARVNYVLNYEALRPHNVDGTRELLRFSFARRLKEFHHISTTFIFGWTLTGTLLESDNNDEMQSLDFGYSQSKWVAERLVFEAEKQGLKVHVYRPALISASTGGVWDENDVAVRLLAFMINHGVAVSSGNQVSFLPADVVADNIASIFNERHGVDRTLHVTADEYYNLTDITQLLSSQFGYSFVYYEIPGFIAELNRRCTRSDPLYPFLGFLNQSHRKIAAMQLKRYNNQCYGKARDRSVNGRSDPSLKDTVSYLMAYMLREGLVSGVRSVDPMASAAR